jgi:serine phosphatase RsbU (regulator of sigma subunit)
VALGLSAIVPVGLLGFDQARRWEASELASSDRQALGAAQAAADQLSLAMLAHMHAAETFSAQLGNGGGLERASLEAALKAHIDHHPEFLGAYVADDQGRSVLGRNESGWTPGGVDYSDRDYYREIQRTGRAAISSVHIGRITGVLTVQVAAPIDDPSGRRLGITCSSVDLEAITEQAKQSVTAMRDGRLMLVDGEGRRIADSSARTRLAPEDVSSLPLFALPAGAQPELRAGEDDLGREVRGFAIRAKAPVAGWHVLALTPRSVIDTQARQVKRQTAALVLALGVSALLVAAAFAAWLARPVRALAAGALAVTRGDFDALPEVPHNAPTEMAQLGRAVRTMIERLRSHARDLELQVQARTAELSLANADISAALDTIRRHERGRNEDLEKARLFQAKLLPALPQRSDLSIAAHYAPLDQVGGDIYDVTELEGGRLRIFVADATGHGVQASMRTLLLKSAYDRLKARCATPSQLLSELNAHLVREFPDGDLHCGACCVELEPSSAPDARAALGILLADFQTFLDGHPIKDDVTVIVVAVPAKVTGRREEREAPN